MYCQLLENTIDGWWEIELLIGAIYRHILGDHHIPDYGLHGVLCVTICGISRMRDAISATTSKSAVVVVRKFFQPILDVACMEVKTVTKGRLNNDKANRKGKVRLECAAIVQFMASRRWESLIDVCLDERGMNNKCVGGRLWGDVCREWWASFA